MASLNAVAVKIFSGAAALGVVLGYRIGETIDEHKNKNNSVSAIEPQKEEEA